MTLRALVVLVCLAAVLCQIPGQSELYYHGQEVDHFDPLNFDTFSQRYYRYDGEWVPSNGGVVLYICGEYECSGLQDFRLWPLDIAASLNATLVVPEHRFYGETQPMPDWTVDSLRLLTVEQALADLAQFLDYFQAQLFQETGRTDIPVFVIGASYPGALSAWFRLKYPHMVKGSIASSGVINPIKDFHSFDTHMYNAIPGYCSNAIQVVTAEAERDIPAAKARYGAEALSDFDFFYMLIDAAVGEVQYSAQGALCDRFQGVTEEEDILDTWWTFWM
ncbi:peptidase S28, partial [Kipferlia bialata]|eukprot:g10439.t1